MIIELACMSAEKLQTDPHVITYRGELPGDGWAVTGVLGQYRNLLTVVAWREKPDDGGLE